MNAPKLTLQTLFYHGGNVGLGDPVTKCFFSVEVNGKKSRWSIAETLSRLSEFSTAARSRILSDCATQIKYGADWEGS